MATRQTSASIVSRAAGSRYVFEFTEGNGGDVSILGGKGAGLAHMTQMGLPVPPGFVVSTWAGREYLDGGKIPTVVLDEIERHLAQLEARTGRRLGDAARPLLVSVRSGAPVSMPGMMDTVLNIGLNAVTVRALAAETGDERFAWRCYQRFVEIYACVVRGIPPDEVEERLMDLEGAAPQEIVGVLLALVAEHGGRPIPDDPRGQIIEAVAAVFGSWNSARARAYRRFRGIADDLSTAATVQAMVFGNRGASSASGVAFTRDPSTGEVGVFGDILFDAQGEEVVAGERDAEPLAVLARRLPKTHAVLERMLRRIEDDAGDLCEVEFTIEEGTLWILQTRTGLRSGRAAVRMAAALADSGRISIDEAIHRITPAQLEAAAAPGFARSFRAEDVIATGLAVSPGAATGIAVFDPARATTLAAAGRDVVLVRPTTAPGDVAGFIAARAVVTGRGGRTSHAAVVARGMHRPAVCGIGDISVSADRRSADIAGCRICEGEVLSTDGDRGLVARGHYELGAPVADAAVKRFIQWCTERARVPRLRPQDVETLTTVDSLEAFADCVERVVLELTDLAQVPPAALAKALSEHRGAPPVLRLGAPWLRVADVRLNGRVAGIVCADESLSSALLQATLTSNVAA